ncbi:methyltransferase domain-containing protein [Mucilaginibacter sp. OK098]|uniref:methyltransferase domain-containing protein n=1 Tax=Mucilaginibacter sp. OK098 TaxID=1855297 RepID=UPI0009235BD9|nr:methyltransferase domain-containing protein [Mucilaginibacter sp. OK098]SHN26146.1 Methyltransferase domain-containing protein [Mucilaginibacter sp. OK098]
MGGRLDTLSVYNFEQNSRSLVQDSSLKTIIQTWIAETGQNTLNWLDICCGDGRILIEIAQGFPDLQINFHGLELERNIAKRAEINAASLKNVTHNQIKIGELSLLQNSFTDLKFDLITNINSIHELGIPEISYLILESFKKLEKKNGYLFLFDLCSLPYDEPEPGAVPWDYPEACSFFNKLSEIFDIPKENLKPNHHRSTIGAWHLSIKGMVLYRSSKLATTLENIENSEKHHKTFIKFIKDFIEEKKTETDRSIKLTIRRFYPTKPLSESEMKEIQNLLDNGFRIFWSCHEQLRIN